MSDWAGLMRLAAERWGLAPETFWRLSLVEWRALAGEAPASMGRVAFEALAARFPDQEEGRR